MGAGDERDAPRFIFVPWRPARARDWFGQVLLTFLLPRFLGERRPFACRPILAKFQIDADVLGSFSIGVLCRRNLSLRAGLQRQSGSMAESGSPFSIAVFLLWSSPGSRPQPRFGDLLCIGVFLYLTVPFCFDFSPFRVDAWNLVFV